MGSLQTGGAWQLSHAKGEFMCSITQTQMAALLRGCTGSWSLGGCAALMWNLPWALPFFKSVKEALGHVHIQNSPLILPSDAEVAVFSALRCICGGSLCCRWNLTVVPNLDAELMLKMEILWLDNDAVFIEIPGEVQAEVNETRGSHH